jgi:hypothetical protein
MSDHFKILLGQIREAYAQLQSGALPASGWKREGASSYTVQKPKSDHAPESAPREAREHISD